MIQYIREFALKNTVSVRLRLGSFLNHLGIGIWGWGLELVLVCNLCGFVALWRMTLRWPGGMHEA